MNKPGVLSMINSITSFLPIPDGLSVIWQLCGTSSSVIYHDDPCFKHQKSKTNITSRFRIVILLTRGMSKKTNTITKTDTATTSSTSVPAKRDYSPEPLPSNDKSKKSKQIHPFFTQSRITESSLVPTVTVASNFQWHNPALGFKRTCLHGTNLSPVNLPRVAAFDLDGTLIRSRKKGESWNNTDWGWWHSEMPMWLKSVHEKGFSVVIITNQKLKPETLNIWKKKVHQIAAAIPAVPFRILTAIAEDGFRKPMPGMWYELKNMFEVDGITIDEKSSFYVGDAAGREGDHSSSDRKWALNIGLHFFTPEEYFLEKPAEKYQLSGFNVCHLPQLPETMPAMESISLDSTQQEIILFVGRPALGKSSFYKHHFSPAGYVHVNQDTLKTRAKCLLLAEKALSDGKSCVIDNTNRNRATRKLYIDLATKMKVPIRCFHFVGSAALAWHNNLYRAYVAPAPSADSEPPQQIIPAIAYHTYQKEFEEPDIVEGFHSIVKVNWTFNGTEEERRRWNMWLSVADKGSSSFND